MKLKSNLSIAVPFLILSLGLASCSDDNSAKTVIPWEIEAPYFKVYDNQTDQASKSQTLNRIDLNNENIKLSTTDELVFENGEKVKGATLKAESLCEAGENQAFKETFHLALLKENSIYRFLPKAVLLMTPLELKTVKCSVRFTAISSNGSTHDFGQNVNFTLNGENRTFLMSLEDENQTQSNSEWTGVALITLQRARYYFLQAKQKHQLKCTNFESSAIYANTLLDLIEDSELPTAHQSDQLCRLFRTENEITRPSQLFSLRFFDTKNLIEDIASNAVAVGIRLSGSTLLMNIHLNKVTLHNRTKYPIFFSSKNQKLKASKLPDQKNYKLVNGSLYLDRPQFGKNIKVQSDKTLFALLPGQKTTVSYAIINNEYVESLYIGWIEKAPTLEILNKKSWEDQNEAILTSIPLMSEPVMNVNIRALKNY